MKKPNKDVMLEKSLYNLAFNKSKSQIKYEVDEGIERRRKSLILASSVGILSSFVKVTGDINIGVVKGKVDSPSLIYVAIIMVCFYFAYWFYHECHKWNFQWYGELRKHFLWSVAEIRVHQLRLNAVGTRGLRFGELKANQSDGVSHTLAATESPLSGTRRDDDAYNLLEEAGFEVDRSGEQYTVKYQYHTTELDEYYFHRFRRFYWQSCAYHAFMFVFPFALFSVATLCLSWRIVILQTSN